MSELYNNLKSFVLGTKTAEIDSQIDSSLQSIELYSARNSHNKYVETIKQLVSKSTVGDTSGVLKNLQGIPQPQYYDQSGRLSRYVEYDAIVSKISYCQRAITTLSDHIISPDDITKKSILFMTTEDAETGNPKFSSIIARLKTIHRKINLENIIDKIIKTTLKKGDYFVEILHSPKGENSLTILREDTQAHEIDGISLKESTSFSCNISVPKVEVKEDENPLKEVRLNVIIEQIDVPTMSPLFGTAGSGVGNIASTSAPLTYPGPPPPMSKDNHGSNSSNVGSKDKNDKKNKEDDPTFGPKLSGSIADEKKFDLKNVFITTHNPKHVIRLETERFRTCLGYLVFPKIDPALAMNSSYGNFSVNVIDGICSQIISKVHDNIIKSNYQKPTTNGIGNDIKVTPELKDVVLSYLKTVKNNEDLKIRYVPPEMMVHWRVNVDRYEPYGESILECVNFDCRLLIALKTATTIKRLTSATDKRTIYVETGLPRDAKNIIETLKEGLGKRKISIDKMGSLDSIPSQVSTFETTYIPMRDGKRFVEIEKQEWGQSANEDIEPLKFIRDGIVANLGVPAPYLGLEENTSNRSLLTTENINFCRTIISYQKELSIYLKEMFVKVYQLVYGKDEISLFDSIRITFSEPKISPYEHEMEYVEQMQRLIEALKGLGIPMSWLKQKYLPNINWEQIDKLNADDTINKELGTAPLDDATGMGGMGGAGGPSLY